MLKKPSIAGSQPGLRDSRNTSAWLRTPASLRGLGEYFKMLTYFDPHITSCLSYKRGLELLYCVGFAGLWNIGFQTAQC